MYRENPEEADHRQYYDYHLDRNGSALEAENQALRQPPVVGRSEQFYCDGQENGKDRCETQCLGCAGMQEIYGQ